MILRRRANVGERMIELRALAMAFTGSTPAFPADCDDSRRIRLYSRSAEETYQALRGLMPPTRSCFPSISGTFTRTKILFQTAQDIFWPVGQSLQGA
jgi:hypothetical protein